MLLFLLEKCRNNRQGQACSLAVDPKLLPKTSSEGLEVIRTRKRLPEPLPEGPEEMTESAASALPEGAEEVRSCT